MQDACTFLAYAEVCIVNLILHIIIDC